MMRPVVCFACALALFIQEAHAQSTGAGTTPAAAAASAMAAWPPATRANAVALIDSATAHGLPVNPLLSKISEGVAKGAEPERIVTVVRALLGNLRTSRATLGDRLSEAELVAAAGALQSGVTPRALESLRSSARTLPSLTLLFVVLTDLTQRGVEPEQVIDALIRLARAGAGDAAFTQLRLDVVRDVSAGIAPGAAMMQRTDEYVIRGRGRGGGPVPAPARLDDERR